MYTGTLFFIQHFSKISIVIFEQAIVNTCIPVAGTIIYVVEKDFLLSLRFSINFFLIHISSIFRIYRRLQIGRDGHLDQFEVYVICTRIHALLHECAMGANSEG